MEDALVQFNADFEGNVYFSLNPCFNGRCTRTFSCSKQSYCTNGVLILVLMEDALVHVDSKYICCVRECLNPCFNGRCTRTDSQKMEVAAKLMS